MQNPASQVDDHGAAVARALLTDSPELRHIQLLWTDLNGILRGKSIQRGELERIAGTAGMSKDVLEMASRALA